MSKILVTGATGFIGTALLKELEVAGHEVLGLSRNSGNISDPDIFRKLPDVELVYHLAARSYVPDSWDFSADFINTNVVGTSNVLDYCYRTGARLVYVSAYLYGQPESLPVKESMHSAPNNPYALSKKLAEQLCEFDSRYRQLQVTVIRPFNVFGPGQRSEFLIPTIVEQLKEENEIRVMDLEPKRDYIYIDDLVAALLKSAGKLANYMVINIGSGVSYSVREIIQTAQELAGTNLPVSDGDRQRTNEINDVYADITCAATELDWQPKISFHNGMKKILESEGLLK